MTRATTREASHDLRCFDILKKMFYIALSRYFLTIPWLQKFHFGAATFKCRYFLVQPSKAERQLMGPDVLQRRVSAVRKADPKVSHR